MSDTSILPGAALPVVDAGVPAPPDFGDDDQGGDDRRRLLILGGIVLALLLVVVGYLLLHGSGSPSSSSAGLVPRGTPPASAPTDAGRSGSSTGHSGSGKGGHGTAGAVLPPKSHTSLARDPFKPLVVDNTASGGTVAGSTTVGSGTSTAPGTVPTTPAQGGGPPASFGSPQAIRLVRVRGAKSALFAVTYAHGKVFRYEVAAPAASSTGGTVFGRDFSLLGIQGSDVTLQVGDATPFDLGVGSSHTV